jgi:hypothetical protein
MKPAMQQLTIVRPAIRVAIWIGIAAALAGCQSAPPAASESPAAPKAANASPAAAETPAATGPLAPLAWLAGCWRGTVNEREFEERWLPLRGGMLVGAAQQVSGGRMQDYEYMRLESRAGDVYFAQFSGDRNEVSFRLASTTTDKGDTVFTFANTTAAFPARLVYRRGREGWLYETIEEAPGSAAKRVVYPLRRIDCESGELIAR